MNVSSLMDTLARTFLLIFLSCTFGEGEGLIPSCEVEVMLRRGLTCITAPQRHLTVSCPAKHCGEPLKVTWWKLLDTYGWEEINSTESVEITQRENGQRNSLSLLTFKRISVYDEGLYRCEFKDVVGHAINVSVSDFHQGVENCVYNAVKKPKPNVVGDKSVDLEPYFLICLGILGLVFTLTAIIFLRSFGLKRILSYNLKKGQEMSTHAIPDLPKGNASVLHDHFSTVNDIYSQSTPETLSSPPSPMTTGNQPGANTASTSQVSDHAAYAVINHTTSGIPATAQHTSTPHESNPQYAAINVSNLSDSS